MRKILGILIGLLLISSLSYAELRVKTYNTSTGKTKATKVASTGDFVGTSDTQELTNKTLTSPKINEDVILTITSTNLADAYSKRVDSWTAPLAYSSQTASITQSNTTTDGYLSSTDWNTFNSKGGALPATDTTNIIKGSADATKLIRFEVDGLTASTTRVLTVPDKDFTIADNADIPTFSDTAYDATSWNGNSDAATKNAIRDKVETMDTAIGLNTAKVTESTSVTSPITLDGVSVGIVNQGTTAQVLHGNAAGNASFGAIVTADITNSNVTYAKIQNVSGTDKILGRLSAGAGIVEEITCTSAGRALIDDADASTQRTTLGVDAAGTDNSTNVTLATDADVLLGLSTQELNLDTQTANTIFAGPTAGEAADPTFRALVDADISATIMRDSEWTAATTSAAGKVELATTAETNTGTDTARGVTPDGLRDSKYTSKFFMVRLLDEDTSHTADTSVGGDYRIPIGATIEDVGAYVDTAGAGSVTTIDIHESGTTILSTKITIDANEKTSGTAATPPVISDTTYTADAIYTFDIDGIASGTAGKGLVVWIKFKP